MTIIVSGSLHVAPTQRDAFLEARVPILEHAREAPGCLDFSLSADLLDAGRVNVYERWRSREDLQLHHISASEAP
jgi:quinol monooxygenase YgiN